MESSTQGKEKQSVELPTGNSRGTAACQVGDYAFRNTFGHDLGNLLHACGAQLRNASKIPQQFCAVRGPTPGISPSLSESSAWTAADDGNPRRSDVFRRESAESNEESGNDAPAGWADPPARERK